MSEVNEKKESIPVRAWNYAMRRLKKVKRFLVRIAKKVIRILREPGGMKRTIWRIAQEFGKNAELKKREKLCQKDFLEKLMPILDAMPTSNGSRYYDRMKVKIAIVADEFLYDSFKDIAEFIYVTPENYREHIEEVDFFLVASAWRGLNQEWRKMASEGTEANEKIHEAIKAYKKAGKVVVFYSKEDPPNYEHFLPIAKKCDVIFTSCVEKVEDYRRDCGTDNVHVMEFCINPVFHNPIGICNEHRTNGVFFAGSWMRKYPERIKAMENMLDGVLEVGKELVIADRNFSQNNPTYFFPAKYYSYTTKEIPHDYLQKVHKLYNWAININSITESKTMFANRVYELQANGCLMISNPSIGVQDKFEEVIIVNSKQDVENALNRYNDEEVYYHQIAGVRRVMTGETNYDRIMNLLATLKIEGKKVERKVLVVVDVITPQVQEMFKGQTYPYKNLIETVQLTEVEYNKYDIVARWNANDIYEKYYLEDMTNGFKYTNCDYITKACYKNGDEYVGSIEHDYVTEITNVYATVYWRESMSLSEFLSMKDGTEKNNGYSIDHFNYKKC